MVLFMFLAFELVGETFKFDHIVEMKILRNTFEFYTVQNSSRFLRLCAKSSSATTQIKATQQYIGMVVFFTLCRVLLTFEL